MISRAVSYAAAVLFGYMWGADESLYAMIVFGIALAICVARDLALAAGNDTP